MAEQEEPKNAAPGQTPSPVKPHKSGLAGTTQHLSHPVDTADRTATVPIAKVTVGGKPMPKPSPSAVPSGAPAGEAVGSNDKTMRLRKNPVSTIKLTPQAPAGTPSPSAAQTIKLVPSGGAAASAPTIKLTPSGGAAASAPTIKLTPQAPAGAPSSPAASTIKLTPSGGAAASAPTIKLTPQAPAGAPSSSAPTIKLTPQASAQTVSPVKMVTPTENAAPQAVKPSGTADTENDHTVRIARPPHTGQGFAPMPEPSASVKPPSAVPGAKQTIKLRPSSTGATVTAMSSPAGGPVKLNASPANKTIKLAPLGNGGVKVVPQTPAAQKPAPAAPAAQQQAAPAPGPAAPRMSQTLKLSPQGSDKKPIGGKTMKLSLHKPAGTPAAGTAGGPAKVPELKLPAAAGKENAPAATEAAAEEKPNIVFFLISIAAMLVVVFTVLLMTVQFANMYHGADVNIPGMTRLTSGPR